MTAARRGDLGKKGKQGRSPKNQPRTGWRGLDGLSEEELRLRIVVPLLGRTSGIEGINDVHGRNEKGLDIIFFTGDGITRTCYGLQLKQGNISGGGTGKQTIAEIVNQLGLASNLEHPIVIPDAGKITIDRFIVATSGRISETARDEIASRITKIPVTFWDGAEIVRRINRYFPELLTGVDAHVVDYLKGLIARYERLDALDQLPGVTQRTLPQIFVEPNLRRKFDPTVSGGHSGTSSIRRVRALQLVDEPGNAVLVAEQNDGKTSILRMLVISRAQRILQGVDSDLALPILLRAKDVLAAASVADAAEAVIRQLGSGLVDDHFREDLRSRRYFVCIDGFSELNRGEERERYDALVTAFARSYPACRVVVTARPEDFLQPKYLREFAQYGVESLDEHQTRALVSKWTSNLDGMEDVTGKMIHRVREALQLPGSPIPAIIGVMVYEEEQRYITNGLTAIW